MKRQRHVVIIRGDRQWCYTSIATLISGIDDKERLIVSDVEHETLTVIKQAQVNQYLGQEFSMVIFDGLITINPDSLGAAIGIIPAGGYFILLLPRDDLHSLWLHRFNRIVTSYAQYHAFFQSVNQGDDLPNVLLESKKNNQLISPTEDQQQAVKAILKVVHGHRRRPLVLFSDRGRGKSSALGMAAATLIQQGKKRIIITAPSIATVDQVFEHAARLLPQGELSRGHLVFNEADISFMAPDTLIDSEHHVDLLMVDEAAAIPAPMLERLLDRFSRIIYATTLHGYEGTGGGFTVRFQKTLDNKTPHWHSCELKTPIRWAQNDQLEAFSFESLLLNAVPVESSLIEMAHIDQCQFECVDRQQLIDDEQSLRALFGLMVLAHYRTRPSDLQMLLDRDDISVYGLRYHGHIIATAWCVTEGELSQDISSAIYAGERRLKGHLLPQSLLAHAGITDAGSLRYQRILRIAVHPAIQHRGIGKAFLQRIMQAQSSETSDVVGVSFSANLTLVPFWLKSGFVPVRLGMHRDDVSGSYALMLLKATSDAGQSLVKNCEVRFKSQWPYLLNTHFKYHDVALIIAISETMTKDKLVLSASDKQEVFAFVTHKRGYEFCQVALWHWLRVIIHYPEFFQLSLRQQKLCIMLVLQQRSWADIRHQLDYAGKSQAINDLREALKPLLGLIDSAS